MAEQNESGKFEIVNFNDWTRGRLLRLLEVKSNELPQCMAYFREAQLDGLYISRAHGFRADTLDFLRDYPEITRICINYSPNLDLAALSCLKNLRLLSVDDNEQPLDLRNFPHLESLRIQWHKRISWPEEHQNLVDLEIRSFRPRSRDFSDLPHLPNLCSLEIIRSPIHSLAGLERFRRLRYLSLSYCTKLERIGELSCKSLRALELDVCRKISDHAHVATLPRLELLKMTHCGQMPSISFVKSMPRLKWFIFAYTHVLDGDMTPCLGLEVVSFDDKKHYSHTCEQIEAMIRERLGPRYPRRTWYEMVGEILSSP
ncbi:MAG: hypothetical protein H5U08_03860 [Thermogutta sp.]|uniref:hypothetical protein n=1 Tax=Thermogutta sp. TaxID=1962930 RepID=UPI0019892F2A|nr:hypothetical protein [Thermogutta sp.]MBC7351473.1 hypothetical protein [Thermogutta sp.]